MARKEEVSKNLACLDKRYRTDIELYNSIDAHLLFLKHGWYSDPNSFWSIAGGESGSILEREIGSDYCLEMTDRIEIAKMNGYYRDTIFNMDELPDDVIDKVAGVLDETETIMERVDDKFLMEAEKNGKAPQA